MKLFFIFLLALWMSSAYAVEEDSRGLTNTSHKDALREAIRRGEYDALFQGVRAENPQALEHYKLGLVLFTHHRGESVMGTQEGLDMAIEELKEALRLDPQFAKAYLTLSQALWEKSFLYAASPSEGTQLQEEAYQAIQKAADLEPADPEINYFHGILLETFKKDYAEAAEAYRRALLEIRAAALGGTRESDVRYALGMVLYNMGKTQEGIQEIRRAIQQMAPDEVLSAKRSLASLLENVGRYQEAVELYEQIGDPKDREKIRSLKEKAKLR